MYKAIIIPTEIFQDGEQFFDKHTLQKGQAILETGRITVSFNRDRDTSFLVSGIVTTTTPHQIKINATISE